MAKSLGGWWRVANLTGVLLSGRRNPGKQENLRADIPFQAAGITRLVTEWKGSDPDVSRDSQDRSEVCALCHRLLLLLSGSDSGPCPIARGG